MTASFDYYELKYPHEGLTGGFIYKTVPHVTLKSIANNPEIDTIFERAHPTIVRTLSVLNQEIKGYSAKFKIEAGVRKGNTLDFKKGDSLLEWEVPFEFPEDWPDETRKPFEAFHFSRQAMQKQMDSSIAAHADSEVLYDQPQVSKTKMRITGPFTVEAVPFATVLGLDEADHPGTPTLP